MTHREPANALHVLVVEDDPDQRDLTRAIIERMGWRVDLAFDGGAAVSRTAALRPDVVLMDLGLPMIDGYQAIRQIRSLRVEPRPHIIVLSAHGDDRSRAEAFAAGCDEFLVKGCDLAAALREYDVALRTRRRSMLSDDREKAL